METLRTVVPIHMNKQVTGSPSVTKMEVICLKNTDSTFVTSGFNVSSGLKTVYSATGWEFGTDGSLSAPTSVLSVYRSSGTTIRVENAQEDYWNGLMIFVFGD